MKKIIYYKIIAGNSVICLTDKQQAESLATSKFFENVFGHNGLVETVIFEIFDTEAAFVESKKKEIVDTALIKLDDVEKYVLGLK